MLDHDGAFIYSADVVRLGLLEVMFTGDRPGIVTDFVARRVPDRVVTQPRKCQISSATDPSPLDLSLGRHGGGGLDQRIKAGPAGGRLRRPSSAGNAHGRCLS
jgi:hypothetical protein